jgi:hypothetical protein
VTEHLVAPGRLKEDPAGLLESISELPALRKRASQPGSHVIDLVMRDVSDALGQYLSPSAKKADPRLRLASLLLGNCESRKALNYLESIIAEAEAAGLPAVAAQAREVQQRIENRSSRQPPGFFAEEDDEEDDIWEDEDDIWEDEDDIWEDEDDDEDSSSGEFAMQEFMVELQKAVAAKDSVMIARVRKSLREMGLTEQMIDQAIAIIANTTGSSRSGKTAKAKKPTKNPGTGPRQIDLF